MNQDLSTKVKVLKIHLKIKKKIKMMMDTDLN